MQHLDGNVLAGPLAELFAYDPTMASTRCAGCGAVSVLAAAMVYMDAMGTVARCADCESVLLTVVESDGRRWATFHAAVEIAPRTESGRR